MIMFWFHQSDYLGFFIRSSFSDNDIPIDIIMCFISTIFHQRGIETQKPQKDLTSIGVNEVKNGLDTVSSSGRMMMKLIGVREEWNREMLIERTNAGHARTIANRTKLGRKSVQTTSIKKRVIDPRITNTVTICNINGL